MTRPSAAVLFLVAAACTSSSSSDPALPDGIVAVAGSDSLSSPQFERFLAFSDSLPDMILGSVFISTWIDQTLFATAMRHNESLDDPATVDSAIAPSAMHGAVTAFLRARSDA